jgi:hypothetical protein
VVSLPMPNPAKTARSYSARLGNSGGSAGLVDLTLITRKSRGAISSSRMSSERAAPMLRLETRRLGGGYRRWTGVLA